MLIIGEPVTGPAIKSATENRDAKTLADFYADDAVIRVVDRNNPPSRPRELRGKAAIARFWEDICGRSMTHEVEASVADEDRIAFTESCTYPDGMKVLAIAVAELRDAALPGRPSSRFGMNRQQNTREDVP